MNRPYSQSLPTLSAIKGGTGPITYSYDYEGELPTGLSFNPTTGVISGTATVIFDPITFTVTATDAAGEIVTKTFTLTGAVQPATEPTSPRRRGSST